MEFPLEDKELRQTYCESLMSMADKDDRIVIVEADLMRAAGTMPFKAKFPDRAFDVGVAEANMIGVAAGLATCGKIPFVSSFGTFASRRCYDQVSISVAYSKLNVKIAGTDPGVSAALNGGTHMPLEDTALMRVMPDMVVYEPVDGVQLAQALPQIASYDGPCYMRLTRRKVPQVFDSAYRFALGKADVLREGSDVVVFASGVMVHKSLQVATEMASSGVQIAVVNLHTVKPLDIETIVAMAKKCGCVVTAENHSVIGGLGGAVCETLSEHLPVPVIRVGVQDRFGEVGGVEYLHRALGVDCVAIRAAVEKAVSAKKR